jgi:hypothetical protein
VPLLVAAGVFAFVLATTPPGFVALETAVLSTGTDPAAYAAGAAASLGLLALVVLSIICGSADLLLRRFRHHP